MPDFFLPLLKRNYTVLPIFVEIYFFLSASFLIISLTFSTASGGGTGNSLFRFSSSAISFSFAKKWATFSEHAFLYLSEDSSSPQNNHHCYIPNSLKGMSRYHWKTKRKNKLNFLYRKSFFELQNLKWLLFFTI